MSETNIIINGFNNYIDKFSKFPDKLIEKIRKQALKDAELLAGEQRSNCPAVSSGLRESIQSFVEGDGDVIIAGTRTNNDHAVYVEFGTGPTGSKKGHPLDAELGIARKTQPWKVYIPGTGVRYTSGQPSNPFMYNAMKRMEPLIKEHFGSLVKEVLR